MASTSAISKSAFIPDTPEERVAIDTFRSNHENHRVSIDHASATALPVFSQYNEVIPRDSTLLYVSEEPQIRNRKRKASADELPSSKRFRRVLDFSEQLSMSSSQTPASLHVKQEIPLASRSLLELQFMCYMKQRCTTSSVWINFLDLFNAFVNNTLLLEGFLYKVALLFASKPDVLICVNLFIPNDYKIAVPKPFGAVSTVIEHLSPDLSIKFKALVKAAIEKAMPLQTFLREVGIVFHGFPMIMELIGYAYATHSAVSLYTCETSVLSKFFDVSSSYNRFTVSSSDPLQFHRIFQLCVLFASKQVAILYIEICRQCLQRLLTYDEACRHMDTHWPCVGGAATQHKLQEIKGLLSDALSGVTAEIPNVATLNRMWRLREFVTVFLCMVSDSSLLLRAEIDGMVAYGMRNKISNISILVSIFKILQPFRHLPFMLKQLLRYVWVEDKTFPGAASVERPQYSIGKNSLEANVRYMEHCNEFSKNLKVTGAVAPRASLAHDRVFNFLVFRTLLSLSLSEITSFPHLSWITHSPRYNLLVSLFEYSKELNCFHEFMVIVYEYSEGLLSVEEALRYMGDLSDQHPSPQTFMLKNKLRSLLEYKADDRNLWYVQSLAQQNTLNWERIGKSYKKLPNQFPILPSSVATANCLLNTQYVALPREREGYTSECSGSSACNTGTLTVALQDLEDQRYDWDLKIKRVETLRNRMERICIEIYGINDLTERRKTSIRPSTFNVLHIQGLTEIYGKKGMQQALLELCCNPCAALPVVHSTIVCKLQQWKMCRSQLECIWRHQEAALRASAPDTLPATQEEQTRPSFEAK